MAETSPWCHSPPGPPQPLPLRVPNVARLNAPSAYLCVCLTHAGTQARAWQTFAQNCSHPYDQLASRRNAVTALEATPLQQVSLLQVPVTCHGVCLLSWGSRLVMAWLTPALLVALNE